MVMVSLFISVFSMTAWRDVTDLKGGYIKKWN